MDMLCKYFCVFYIKVMGPKNKGSVERRCLAGRTPLSDIFRGLLRSRLQRATDSAMSDTTHCVQPFFTLPLDIEVSILLIYAHFIFIYFVYHCVKKLIMKIPINK